MRLLRACFTLWLFASCLAATATAQIQPTAPLNTFDLRVTVDKDTVRSYDTVRVQITFANKSGRDLSGFRVATIFPNVYEKYMSFIGVVRPPARGTEPFFADPIADMRWDIGDFTAGDADTIVYALRAECPPSDTLFLNYIATAHAFLTETSQNAATNILAGDCIPNDNYFPPADIALLIEPGRDSLKTGDTGSFSIKVTNKSNVVARQVYVIFEVPVGLQIDTAAVTPEYLSLEVRRFKADLAWFFAEMQPFEEHTLVVPFTVVAAPRRGSEQLTAIVRARHSRPDREPADNFAASLITVYPCYDLELYILHPPNGAVDPGQTETYEIGLRNKSTVALLDFRLQLDIDDGNAAANCYSVGDISHEGFPDAINESFSWRIDTLAAGDSTVRTITLRYDNIGSASPGQAINFNAAADSVFDGEPDLTPENNRISWTRDKNNTYDLVLSGDNARPSVPIGQMQTYELTVTNNSLVDLPAVDLRVYLVPEGATTLDNIVVSTGGSLREETDRYSITWRFDGFTPGQAYTRSFDAMISGIETGGTFCFRLDGEVDVVDGEVDTLNNRASWQTCASVITDLAITSLEPGSSTIPPGARRTIQIGYANLGSLTKENAVVRSTISPAPASSIYSIDASSISDAGTLVSENQIEWTISSLEPAAGGQRSFDLLFDRATGGGNFAVNVEAAIDPFDAQEENLANNKMAVDYQVQVRADLAITAIAPQPRSVDIGERARIDVDFANLGELDKERAIVRTRLAVTPAGLNWRLENVDGAGLVQQSATLLEWAITPLPAAPATNSGRRSFDIVFEGIERAGEYRLEVTAEIDPFDATDDAGNNRQSTNFTLRGAPVLELLGLEGRPSALVANDTVTCYFEYRNSGAFRADDARLNLTLSDDLLFVDWTFENQNPGVTSTGRAAEAQLGTLPPGFVGRARVTARTLDTRSLRARYPNGATVDVQQTISLAATGAASPNPVVHTARLNISAPGEKFHLSRNRFRPSEHGSLRIYFVVTQSAEVGFKIYNIAGELIRSFPPQVVDTDDQVVEFWDGRNDRGDRVASGLYYIYAVANYDHKQPVRNVVVIR